MRTYVFRKEPLSNTIEKLEEILKHLSDEITKAEKETGVVAKRRANVLAACETFVKYKQLQFNNKLEDQKIAKQKADERAENKRNAKNKSKGKKGKSKKKRK